MIKRSLTRWQVMLPSGALFGARSLASPMPPSGTWSFASPMPVRNMVVSNGFIVGQIWIHVPRQGTQLFPKMHRKLENGASHVPRQGTLLFTMMHRKAGKDAHQLLLTIKGYNHNFQWAAKLVLLSGGLSRLRFTILLVMIFLDDIRLSAPAGPAMW